MKSSILWASFACVVCAAVTCLMSPATHASELQLLDEAAEGEFNLTGEIRFSSPDELDARVLFNIQPESGDHYALALTGGTAKFYYVSDGVATHLGTVGRITAPAEGSEAVLFTLQRRDWRIALVWGDEVIARAYDSRLHDGQVGTLAISGSTFEDLMVQPTGEIFLADDFVREEETEDDWEPVSGRWQQRSLRDDEQAERQEADKSANAFSYTGQLQGDAPAISVTGYWFWDAYSLEAAIQPGDSGSVGLVFHYQDPDNYMLVRWWGRDHLDGGSLQLIAMHAGTFHVISETNGGFRVGQWYALRCAVADGLVQVWVDDELRLVGHTDLFGQGQVGLYSETRELTFFDDVVCLGWELFTDDFAQEVPGKWHSLTGQWQPGDQALQTVNADPAIITTGRRAWNSYSFSASVQPGKGGACGLVVGYQGPDNFCLLRWATNGTEYAGRAQIVQVDDGTEKVLAEAALSVPVRGRYRAEATLRDGVISLSLDGRKQVEALAPDITCGAIGLYADGSAGTLFQQALLRMISPPRSSRIVAEFTDISAHPEMAEWASTRAPWLPAGDEGKAWWTKGDYFGEHALQLTIPDIGSKTGQVQLFLGGEGPDDPEAYELTIAVETGSKDVQFALARGDRPLEDVTATVEEPEATISFERKDQWLVVLVNGTVVLQAEAATVPALEEQQ